MAIRTVKLNKESMIKFGPMKRGARVTRRQLMNLESNLASRLEQNADRRAAGAERAGEYLSK